MLLLRLRVTVEITRYADLLRLVPSLFLTINLTQAYSRPINIGQSVPFNEGLFLEHLLPTVQQAIIHLLVFNNNNNINHLFLS